MTEVVRIEIAGWNSYLLDDPDGLTIVDPGPSPGAVIDAVTGLAGRYGDARRVVATGISGTHVTSAPLVAAHFGVPVVVPPGIDVRWDDVELQPAAGQNVWLTPEAARLVLVRPEGLFTGQAVPCSGPPRLDMPATGRALSAAVSLAARVLAADAKTLFPADCPPATIADLCAANPFLLLDGEALLQAALSTPPPRPLNADAVVATNRGHADMAWAMPLPDDGDPVAAFVQQIPADGLARRLGTPWEPVVVDIREPAETATGIVEGSRTIPQARLATGLVALAGEREIVVVSGGGSDRRARDAARFLVRCGYRNVGVLTGGMDAARSAGLPIV